jgi:hypothetical protein
MATITLEPREQSRSSGAIHGQLTNPLHKLRSGIRTFVTLDILLFVGVFAVFFFWLGIGFDYGIFKITGFDVAQQTPKGLRIASLALFSILLGFLVFTRVKRMMTRDFSYPSLAMVLEKRYPKLLGDRLITAVELSDVKKAERQGYSGEMIEHTINEARERIGQINVSSVFRWSRLYWKAVYIGLFMLLGLTTSIACSTIQFEGRAIKLRSFQPGAFTHKLTDVVAIWGERNLMMKNTPWPRRAHLELVDFPASGELRIGKDAGAPRVKARAYKWVIVQSDSYNGWRPLMWSDLARPEFAISAPASVVIADTSAGGSGSMATKELNLSGMSVDDVEAQVGANSDAVATVFARLESLTADPWMSRTVRQLTVPRDLMLRFTGASGKTRGDVNLTRDPSGEFAGDVTGIAENVVSFVVSGEDFRTPTQSIQLIPKPVLIELKRDEYVPAYLYHAAPIDGPPAIPGTEAVRGQAALRGLRQRFMDKRISLTGDRSVFSVPVGTELEITATADKKLKKVTIAAKTGSVPDFSREAATAEEGFESFTVPFKGAHTITEPTEFEYTMTDFDNVSAKRSILIQVTEDQPPTVELFVDVLRKVGNAYMVTPIVAVPFSPDSTIKDDTGLSKVEFEFSYTRMESEVVQKLQAQLAVGLANAFGSPVTNWGTPLLMGANDTLYRQIGTKNENKTFRSSKVMRFEQEYNALPRETYARLLQKLNEPLKTDQTDVVKLVKLLDPKSDYFDLQLVAPNLLAKPEDIQPHYRLELNIAATDVNAELVGKGGQKIVGKTGQNIETIQFLVVSEAELLVEISRDEKTQLEKLEELYKRVVDAQAKLNQEIGYLRSPTKDQIENSRIRALDILQDIAKSKEQLSGIQTEYERLYREIQANRCSQTELDHYIRADGKGILDRTKRLIDGTEAKGNFPLAESAVGAFQTALNNLAAPDDVTTNIARNEVARLIAALDDLRNETGKLDDLNKLRKDIFDLIKGNQQIGGDLNRIVQDELDKLRQPKIVSAKPVTIAVGKTASIKHAIDWKLYDKGELYIRIDTPKDSGLKVPAEITIKDDLNEFSFDVTAGMKAGSYILTLVPGVGKPVEVQVIVTK